MLLFIAVACLLLLLLGSTFLILFFFIVVTALAKRGVQPFRLPLPIINPFPVLRHYEELCGQEKHAAFWAGLLRILFIACLTLFAALLVFVVILNFLA